MPEIVISAVDLPASVGAQQSDQLAFAYLQRDALQARTSP